MAEASSALVIGSAQASRCAAHVELRFEGLPKASASPDFLNPESNILGARTGTRTMHASRSDRRRQVTGEGFMRGTQNQFHCSCPSNIPIFRLRCSRKTGDFLGCLLLVVLYAYLGFAGALGDQSCSDREGSFRRSPRRSASARSFSGTRSSTSGWSSESFPSSELHSHCSQRVARVCSP